VSDETWGVEDLRLTLFRLPGESVTGAWEALTGEQPTNQTASPKLHIYHEDGPFLGGVVSVDVTRERHDVRCVALPGDPPLPVTPSLGAFDHACTPFRELCSKWIHAQTFAVRRVALGVTARLLVPSLVAGYTRLGEFLPTVTLSTASSDFFYQINRPRPSKMVPGLVINRLSRWSVQRIQFASVAVGPGAPPAATIFGEPFHSCRVELDLNTAAEHGSDLEIDAVIAVLSELQSFASELLKVGDVE